MQRVCQRLARRVHPGGRGRRRTRPGWSPPAATRPLVVGLGEGENFLGSDVAAFIEHTREALELGQDQVVTITRDGRRGHRASTAAPAEGRRYHVDWDLSAAEKDGHDWFMRKEIFEQPHAVADALLGRHTVGASCSSTRCGSPSRSCATSTRSSSSPAARRSTPAWWRSTRSSTGPGCRCEVELAYGVPLPRPDPRPTPRWSSRSASRARPPTRCRRSGTRATQRSKVLAICNTNGSTIPRESDAVIYTHAGPEIGVASTKGFMTQLVACYLLALYLAQVKGTRYGDEIAERGAPARGDARPPRRRMLDAQDEIYALAARRSSTRGRCCSSAGTPATRSPSRARSSSRSSPTSTPRASRPASSSTGRSR